MGANSIVLNDYPENSLLVGSPAKFIKKQNDYVIKSWVITDIDGVWTDGGMYYTAEGDVMKRFSVKDGWGIVLLRELNIPIAIMTGENSQVVRKQCRKVENRTLLSSGTGQVG